MKIRNLFIIVSIILILFMLVPNVSLAEYNIPYYMNPQQFDDNVEIEEATNFIDVVLGYGLDIIQIITFGTAVVLLIVYGIRYVSYSASNPERKSELKKQLPMYCIGVVLLFGSSLILTLIKMIINDVLPMS